MRPPGPVHDKKITTGREGSERAGTMLRRADCRLESGRPGLVLPAARAGVATATAV
jgi:hypothetical protein